MRTAAVVLAALTAVGELAVFAYGEAHLATVLLEHAAADAVAPWWSRALWAVGWALPWAVGAAVLAWGRPRAGTAVVVAIAALSVSEIAGIVQLVDTLAPHDALDAPTIGALALALLWVAGTAAGVTAWLARPRGGWHAGAPGPGALFTVAAIAAWLPTAFRSTAFAPPGAPRRFVEPLATGLEPGSAAFIVYPVVVGLILLAAPRMRRLVAGAVTLTFAIPQLVSHAATLRTTLDQDVTIPTPAGVLGLLGLVVLVAVGTAWVVSDAATGPGPAEVGGDRGRGHGR